MRELVIKRLRELLSDADRVRLLVHLPTQPLDTLTDQELLDMLEEILTARERTEPADDE